MLTVGNKLPIQSHRCVSIEPARNSPESQTCRITANGSCSFSGRWISRSSVRRKLRNSEAQRDFTARDAQVLGASIDTQFVHLAWRTNHPDLRDLPFPMLADVKHELSEASASSTPQRCRSRATFIVDPEGTSVG